MTAPDAAAAPGALARILATLHAEAFETPWSEAVFADLLGQNGVRVEAEPDGFVLVRTAADEAEILTLAVRPRHRRRGIASRLMAGAAARATRDGARRLFLEVAEDNGPARALYDRLGFAVAGRRPRYYARTPGHPVDALILVLNLTGPLPSA